MALKEIEIKNFKCFESLRLEGLQRVNLIGGKNNIGKTSFMEAVELFVSSPETNDLFFAVYKMIRRRQHTRTAYRELDFINELNSKIEILSDNGYCSLEYVEDIPSSSQTQLPDMNEDKSFITNEPSLRFTVNSDEKVVPIERIISYRQNIMVRRDRSLSHKVNFISPTTSEERDIAIFYGALVDLNKEVFLNESLHLFDENIISLKQKAVERDIVLKIEVKDRDTPILLSSLGDGVNRYIAILCAIWASQDGFLFIDEIENGIHYTNYKKLWDIILKASDDANCQLFITTHSKECIDAFNEVNRFGDGAYFEFYRNMKENKISVSSRNKEQLDYALSHNGRIRGE